MTNQFPDATKKVLSPAAQAVLDATDYPEDWATRIRVAAALKAAADQVVPEEPLYGGDQRWMFERDARQASRRKLLTITDELEGVTYGTYRCELEAR
jgi:hypothetical protein